MANEIPNRVHAGGVFVSGETVDPPFTERMLAAQGVNSFERLSTGQYLLTLQRPIAFAEGYAQATLPPNFLAISGAQISQDGTQVLISCFNIAVGDPVDPPIVMCTVWAVREGEGQGPAIPFPPLPAPIPGGLFPGFGGAPPDVAPASDAGVSGLASRSDHTHGHGSQPLGDGTDHADVTDTFSGFMSPAMLVALNTLVAEIATKKVSFQCDATDAIFEEINLGSGAIANPDTGVRGTHAVLNFEKATVRGIPWQKFMPAGYDGTNNLRVSLYWVALAATTGNVVWAAAFERDNAGGDDIDSESFAALQTAAPSAAPGTAGVIAKATIDFTQAQADAIAAGEPLRLFVQRTSSDGSDTMADTAQLLRVVVEEIDP